MLFHETEATSETFEPVCVKRRVFVHCQRRCFACDGTSVHADIGPQSGSSHSKPPFVVFLQMPSDAVLKESDSAAIDRDTMCNASSVNTIETHFSATV